VFAAVFAPFVLVCSDCPCVSNSHTENSLCYGIHCEQTEQTFASICSEIQHSVDKVWCVCERSVCSVCRYPLQQMFVRALFVCCVCSDLLQVSTGLYNHPGAGWGGEWETRLLHSANFKVRIDWRTFLFANQNVRQSSASTSSPQGVKIVRQQFHALGAGFKLVNLLVRGPKGSQVYTHL